ncbi:MAG: sodium-dependent transporter [Clostridia bacterium]|nr:sodium-dependent transporter [Clostridia bacterium]
MKRESFQSRLGFILVSAGCAIGIGNVWRFPYVAGENGGGLFVLLYLLFLAVLGVPTLTMELAVGRASGKSALHGFKALEKPGHKWHLHGWACMLGNYVLMMFYTTVCGWMMSYFAKFLTGSFTPGMDTATVTQVFTDLKADPIEMTVWMAVTVILGFIVCSFGLQNGLERISKYMMSALLVLIVILAVNSILLPNGGEGLKFYLLPDFKRAADVGFRNVLTAAMNQAFFTLSLGIGSMQIFGSYMKKDNTLTGEAVRICVLDTFVALMSGLIIFPACSAFGVATNSGPSLIFETLPNVFVNMTGGRIWGALFFLFMTFASFTTVIAVFENLLSSCIDNFGWSRKKASVINCIFMLIASMPCILGLNVLKHVQIAGRNFMDMEDFLVSNILLPVGCLIFLLFCVTRWGWGFDKYLEETNTGNGMKMPRWLKPVFQFVLPVLIILVLLQGLIPA